MFSFKDTHIQEIHLGMNGKNVSFFENINGDEWNLI